MTEVEKQIWIKLANKINRIENKQDEILKLLKSSGKPKVNGKDVDESFDDLFGHLSGVVEVTRPRHIPLDTRPQNLDVKISHHKNDVIGFQSHDI